MFLMKMSLYVVLQHRTLKLNIVVLPTFSDIEIDIQNPNIFEDDEEGVVGDHTRNENSKDFF